jgi:outer membrane protein TolC
MYDVLVVTGTLAPGAYSEPSDYLALARQTPAARQAQARLRSAVAGVTAARSGFSPSLDARASGIRSGDTWPPDRDRWSIGASLSIPFFNGGFTWFDTQRALAERRRAAFTVSSTDLGQAADLESAFGRYRDAVERLDIQKQYLEAAVVRADIARAQYANGLLSYQDWDLIENELVNRQRTRLDGLRDARAAEADWESAQGIWDPEWSVR